ncbi:MAG: HD domain-containing protein [Desulfobacteraceae bacterium]|nr:MAG: HD domain-containing protein [Desulfobacteraceae bacterium]
MLSEREKIGIIAQISMDFNETKDIDLLLERILTNVRKFFDADAGSIYLREGDKLKFSYTQNDTLQKRLEPGKKLIYSIFSIPISTRSIAGYAAKKLTTVNIPDSYKLDDSVPFTFDSNFDKISNYSTRSVLAVPMTNQRKDVMGVMQLINARNESGEIIPFSPEDEGLVTHFANSAALALERAQMTRNIILRMISMAELRDPKETGSHVNRVAAYSVEIFEEWARAKGLAQDEVRRKKDLLRMAAMLHDVGKVAISDLILKKPARLTFDEFETMKTHTYLGARLFKDVQSDFEEVAATVALNHHEKWDGTGYPGHIDLSAEDPLHGCSTSNGLPRPKSGEDIPLFGRIVAVADVYDALCCRRCYKDPWDESRIVEEMQRCSGTHFDPEVISAFFSCLDVLKSICLRYPDDEEKKG